MRIRNYRQGDIPILASIYQKAARVDGVPEMSEAEFEEWLVRPEAQARSLVFLITDDDETNEWGQGGTLEGVEGEAIGYTVLQMHKSSHAYHFLCEGVVLPQHRKRGAGGALLLCAINHARMWATELQYEARKAGLPLYFEALLPLHDGESEKLARMYELEPVDERALKGMRLYRMEL